MAFFQNNKLLVKLKSRETNTFLFRMPNPELCFNLDKVPIIVSFKSSQHNQYFEIKLCVLDVGTLFVFFSLYYLR